MSVCIERQKKFFVGQDVLTFVACERELFFCYDGKSRGR
jgi:hypothetical protein